MKIAKTVLICVPALACLQGCNDSVLLHGDEDVATDSATDTGADAATDTATDTATDAATDTATDTATDAADTGPDVPPPSYVLHEWGVMVMEDGGGATMRGPAPYFAGAIPAKPVLYFYADEEISPLTIAVDFASGGATEVWPEIWMGPRIVWNDLRLWPGPCTTTAFPVPWDDDPWEDGMCEACNLSSCVVSGASCLDYTNAAGGHTISDLLFYTGTLPDYEPPLSAEVRVINDPTFVDRVEVTISNVTARPVRDVWFVYRQATCACIDPSACPVTGADLAWAYLDEVPAASSLDRSLDVVRVSAAVDPDGFPIEELVLPEEWVAMTGELDAKLAERGLTAGESAAFLRNWETIFFGLMGSDSVWIEPLYRDGSALAYFMSTEDYDAQLPLTATPPPAETVRVGMVYQHIP